MPLCHRQQYFPFSVSLFVFPFSFSFCCTYFETIVVGESKKVREREQDGVCWIKKTTRSHGPDRTHEKDTQLNNVILFRHY